MATTFIDYTGDGNATKSFSFPSIQVSDVKVEVDEVLKTSGVHYNITGYTTTGGGNVVFTSGNIPNSPSNIRIFRDTDVDSPKATYFAGSSVKAADLNDNNEQLLFSAQEEQNQTIQTHKIKDSAVTSVKIKDGTIVNADVNASAAIAGTKISPDFGSQNIATTGTVNGVTTTELAILDGATVTTAELNILDGVTATTSEINILDGVTATTTEINKLDGVTADTSELNILDGVTATTSELNIMDGVTATTSEINILDGVTATATELNLLDGVTATTTELNLVDGVTATTAELNFVDGVTSNIQTQLNAKQPLDSELTTLAGMQSGTASILADSTALTATTAEINQLDGITLETSLTTNSDQRIPTSKAVNDQILAVTNALGGFVAIADETSFPATNPDPSNDAGTVVSISELSSGSAVTVNSSGVATIANGAGTGNTVTITGFPTTLRSTSLAASSGLQVQTTTTSGNGSANPPREYTFHKQLASAADIAAISATVNSFSNRYRVSASAPTSSLDGGDLWYDTTNSKLMVYSSQNSAWEESTAIGNFFICTISSSSATGGGSATPNGTAYRFTISDAPTTAAACIVSVDGVIQKPNSGSSQPSEGFVLVGNDIIFGAAPANGASLFVTVIGSTVGIGTPSNNTVTTAILQNGSVTTAKIVDANVTTDKIADDAITTAKIADDAVTNTQLSTGCVSTNQIANGAILNADVNASAAIAGTKISPDFGSQNVVTTGKLGIGTTSLNSVFPLTIQAQYPGIQFLDAQGTDAFGFNADGNTFRIQKGVGGSGPTVMLEMATASSTFSNNLNANAGLDVTGNITVTGTVDGRDIASDANLLLGITQATGVLHTNVSATTQNAGTNNTSVATTAFVQTALGSVTTDLVGDTSPQLGGSLDVNGNNISFVDSTGTNNNRATFGASNDMAIYHDGSNSRIKETGTGHLILSSDGNGVLIQSDNGQNLAKFLTGGAAELYHNYSKKFETTSSGTNFTAGTAVFNGPSGTSYTAEFRPFNSNPYGLAVIENSGANAGYPLFAVTSNNGQTYFRTLSGGASDARDIRPVSNNTYDLGTSSLRWRNIYTNDLNLSNEGSSNDVDGTWGDWTIQEGESDLFLKNNRSGKKYKFNLTEVS